MPLVRVTNGIVNFNAGASHAKAKGLTVLDESAYGRDGQPKPVTRANGRPRKPKTSVADQVAEKKAATESADTDNPSSSKES